MLISLIQCYHADSHDYCRSVLHCSWLRFLQHLYTEMYLKSDAAVINILNPDTQMRIQALRRNQQHFTTLVLHGDPPDVGPVNAG